MQVIKQLAVVAAVALMLTTFASGAAVADDKPDIWDDSDDKNDGIACPDCLGSDYTSKDVNGHSISGQSMFEIDASSSTDFSVDGFSDASFMGDGLGSAAQIKIKQTLKAKGFRVSLSLPPVGSFTKTSQNTASGTSTWEDQFSATKSYWDAEFSSGALGFITKFVQEDRFTFRAEEGGTDYSITTRAERGSLQ